MLHAIVLIKVKIGKINAILKELKEMPNVIEAYATTGIYDIIAKVLVTSL